MVKVLVTGGGGFLGSHVCEYYKKKGADVVAFDNLTKHELMRTGFAINESRLHNWKYLEKLKVDLAEGDIRNKSDLLEAAKDCNFIVHTAAQPSMTISIESPEFDLMSNVVGTFNVLETARKVNAAIVSCSSIHVYGNDINKSLKEEKNRFVRKPETINEDNPLMQGTTTPLHASKIATEFYIRAFAETYGLKAAVFRLTGMYGPRQFGGEDHGWVANFAIRTILGLPIKVFGTDKQVRDILYASDAAEAFDAFYKNQKPGVYNIGGGPKNIISIKECLDLLSKMTKKKQNIEQKEFRTGDLWYFVSDISKAKKELKWEPKVSNEEGIGKLVKWIEENVNIFKEKS
jgi:CDP-paratose 2-epimerase